MHEMSVALEICRIAEDQVGREALPRIREVGLEVGRMSGIEPDNLVFCLEVLLERPPFAGARPVLELTPGDDLRVTWLEVDDGGTTH
jgi:hydrogenase nickel incorporation protein HypA/HybF